MNIARLSSADDGFDARFQALLASEPSGDDKVRDAVETIIAAVRRDGDAAALDCARRFDQEQADSVAALEVPLSA
ncbi:MAG: histidinol dehydrogenase, partial [Alcanivorax sp.]|nr:histidinol dehydrogenase [Alcanivorax sp.]